MNFRLNYIGRLPTSGSNTSGRPAAKWAIRKAIQPQLAYLFKTHPVYTGLGFSFTGMSMGHTLVAGDVSIGRLESVARALAAPVVVDGKAFIPLVRKSLELTCELEILFLRRGEPGALILPGGDIDNRLKTLFDALKIPSSQDLAVDQPDADPFFCLLEDDSLITGFNVETDRLLIPPQGNEDDASILIRATIRVMKITSENVGFLSE